MDLGDASVPATLATMYADGRGVPINRVAAFALLNLVAANITTADSPAANQRAELAKLMSTGEVEQGQELSRELTKSKSLLATLDQFISGSTR